MTTDKQPIDIHDSKSMPFGTRLQSAREAMQLERKDVAAQLRLNERIIIMMEKNRYAADIPVTFIRGYLRSYAKFLNIPEHETKRAVEHIKAKPVSQQSSAPNTRPLIIGNKGSYYFMHIFTVLIVITLFGLIGTWWYAQNQPTSIAVASTQLINKTNTLLAPLIIEPPAPTPAQDAAKNVDITRHAETAEATEPAATAAPVESANKVVASKQIKPTIQSDDYEDDEEE